jgi:hypothetical protein
VSAASRRRLYEHLHALHATESTGEGDVGAVWSSIEEIVIPGASQEY